MRGRSPGWPEASPGNSLALQDVSGNPVLGVTSDGDKGFEVIETERSPVAPRAGLISEWAGEGR